MIIKAYFFQHFSLCRIFFRVTLSLMVSICFVGCMTPDATMKTFIGRHSSELLRLWGPPNDRSPDGRGGEVWTYYQTRQWTSPGYVNSSSFGNANTYGNVYGNNYTANTYASGSTATTFMPAQTQGYNARRTFMIGQSGLIMDYSWQGL